MDPNAQWRREGARKVTACCQLSTAPASLFREHPHYHHIACSVRLIIPSFNLSIKTVKWRKGICLISMHFAPPPCSWLPICAAEVYLASQFSTFQHFLASATLQIFDMIDSVQWSPLMLCYLEHGALTRCVRITSEGSRRCLMPMSKIDCNGLVSWEFINDKTSALYM